LGGLVFILLVLLIATCLAKRKQARTSRRGESPDRVPLISPSVFHPFMEMFPSAEADYHSPKRDVSLPTMTPQTSPNHATTFDIDYDAVGLPNDVEAERGYRPPFPERGDESEIITRRRSDVPLSTTIGMLPPKSRPPSYISQHTV